MRLIFCIFVFSFLFGCGFQLRGTAGLPAALTPLYVESQTTFGTLLTQRVRNAQPTQIVENPAQARLIVRILAQQRQSRVVAVDRAGKALAYELSYHVRFAAHRATGEPVLDEQTLVASRSLDEDPEMAVLGKQLEQELIYQELLDELAERLLWRLQTIAEHNNEAT